jgi:hypothetical protein
MRVQGGRAQRGQQRSRKCCRRGGSRAGKQPFPCLAVVQFADEAIDDLLQYGACLVGALFDLAACLG